MELRAVGNARRRKVHDLVDGGLDLVSDREIDRRYVDVQATGLGSVRIQWINDCAMNGSFHFTLTLNDAEVLRLFTVAFGSTKFSEVVKGLAAFADEAEP